MKLSGFFINVLFFFLLFRPVPVYSATYTVINRDSFAKTVWGNAEPEEEKAQKQPRWLKYAVPVPDDIPEDAPMIAVVIDDLGVNRKMTDAALSLPAPITASFLSYAEDLEEQTDYARELGHELLLHTPMEPVDRRFYPGPDALKTEMSAKEIRENLIMMLDAFDGYVGINNHMGSKFTSDGRCVSAIMEELEKRDLLFLDSLTSSKSVAWKQAQKHHIPYAVRDVFLDNSLNRADIMEQLYLLERKAVKNHIAVAIGHPHKETVQALAEWIPDAKARGFVFVPVSMVAIIRQSEY